MPMIIIDNKEYETDTLSAQANAEIASLQFVEQEIKRKEAELAVLKTARFAYSQALQKELAQGKE